ncbi:MAG: RNA polymerase sigma factor [Limisphaerales bacterium]
MPEAVEKLQSMLLRRVASRDRDALSQFYDHTARPLFAVAWRMLGNAEEAEEVIQDVFVQIWSNAERFDEAKGQAFHWALSITRNRCIDQLRARQRRARVILDPRDEDELESAASPPPEDGRLPEQELAAIRSAVRALPDDQRQAIEMAFFQGMTHLEIAAALQEPLGTVKARIRRGMLKLREALRVYL